jgi:hypothetical protein
MTLQGLQLHVTDVLIFGVTASGILLEVISDFFYFLPTFVKSRRIKIGGIS